MQITFDNFKNIRIIFTIVAIIIVVISIYFTNKLVKEMEQEEQQRIELWAEATQLVASNSFSSDFSFALKVLENNNSIPVMIVDENEEVITHRNIKLPVKNVDEFLKNKLAEMKDCHDPIRLDLDENTFQNLYYDDSLLLKRLSYYPIIQAGLIIAFFCLLFFFFSSAKRSEQNRVWVGLSKETAHQLGTPISSLMAWMEIIKSGDMPNEMIPEMEKDVKQLQIVAERFSKIGSIPELQLTSIKEVVDGTLTYMQNRCSRKIKISAQYDNEDLYSNINKPLFAWVLENLCKNSIDAIAGDGYISAHIFSENGKIIIDVEDNGKGIPKSKFKTIFNPGFTTKKRGWGLGLSLVKRIVEEYHHGKIFVKKSEIGKGTTIRIQIKEEKAPI